MAIFSYREKLNIYRHWLLAVALLCFCGFTSASLLHDHGSDADELACPVCHVLAHQVLDLPAPGLAPPVVIFTLLFLLALPSFNLRAVRPAYTHPPSRAPPHLV